MMSGKKVLRKDYLKKLRGGKDVTHSVKVITGMRRSGKSVLLEQFAEELRRSGVEDGRIIFIDLDSKKYEDVEDFKDLNAVLESKISVKGRVYVFLDEVQKVEGWERTVNSLLTDYDADIYISGSNAYLLSSELSTYLSGRYVEIEILPLSFKEYLELHPPDAVKNLDTRFAEYVHYGALPIIDPDAADKEFIYGQIEGVYNTVLVKDVQLRLKPKSIRDLEDVSKFMYSNIGNVTSISNISAASRNAQATVKSYVDALEMAYLFYRVRRFDIKGKKLLDSTEKYYASDTGIRNTVLNGGDASDTGRLLENVVFLELIRRGYKVTSGSYRDLEIDFTAKKGDRTEYYQVTESMIRSGTAEREVRSLDCADDNYPKTVLSLDRMVTNPGKGIRHINLTDWLLGKD